MASETIKRINRQTSIQTLGVILLANILLAFVYYKTLYVRQASIDESILDSMSTDISHRICLSNPQDAFLGLGYQ